MEDLAKARAETLKEMLRQGENIWVKIKGQSMWPFLRDGQIVMVSPLDINEAVIGDIVLGYISGSVVCHRLFRKRAGLLQTKADALAKLDPFIPGDDLIGRIVAAESKGRILKIDGRLSRCLGFLISRLTLITSHCYPVLRAFKKILVNRILKT